MHPSLLADGLGIAAKLSLPKSIVCSSTQDWHCMNTVLLFNPHARELLLPSHERKLFWSISGGTTSVTLPSNSYNSLKACP